MKNDDHGHLGSFILLALSTTALVIEASQSFNIIPSSQVVSVGEEADFICHHPTADLIDWFVNGSLVGRSPPPGVLPGTMQTDNGTLLYTLTIMGRPEYNGTVVVCEAFFRGGSRSEFSPEALLVLLDLDTTHLPPGGTAFVESPTDQVVAQGQPAVFYCQHTTAFAIGWRLNDIPLLDTNFVGVEARSTSFPSGVQNTLTIEARLEYNLTRVECVAFFDNSIPETTEAVVLKIQGQVDAVRNLTHTSSLITWESPFSLNLTNIEPDIIFCIEVFLTDCGEENLILRDYNVTSNYYDHSSILYSGYIRRITVTPRSNIANALPGIPAVLQEEYAPLNKLSVIVNYTSITTAYTRDIYIYAHFNVLLGAVLPTSYTLSLDSADGLAGPISKSLRTLFVYTDNIYNSVSLSSSLPSKRLWLYTLLPNNCSGTSNSLSNTTELSTHDIQNLQVTNFPQEASKIKLFGDFVTGTSASGALIIVYSSQLTRYHLAPRGGNERLDTTVSNLPSGTYKVSVFNIEENGKPFERVVTRPLSFNIIMEDGKGARQQKQPFEYKLTSSPAGVNVTCQFLDSSSTMCLIIVHTLITNLTSDGLMNIKSSYLLTRPNGINFVSSFIEGLNLNQYQVGAIGTVQQMNESDLQSSAGHTCNDACPVIISILFGMIVGVLLFVFLMSVTVYIIRRKGSGTHSRSNELDTETQVELKRCAAYEVTSLSGKKVVMKENLAYECVTVSQLVVV